MSTHDIFDNHCCGGAAQEATTTTLSTPLSFFFFFFFFREILLSRVCRYAERARCHSRIRADAAPFPFSSDIAAFPPAYATRSPLLSPDARRRFFTPLMSRASDYDARRYYAPPAPAYII